jgi:hypothetical protein
MRQARAKRFDRWPESGTSQCKRKFDVCSGYNNEINRKGTRAYNEIDQNMHFRTQSGKNNHARRYNSLTTHHSPDNHTLTCSTHHTHTLTTHHPSLTTHYHRHHSRAPTHPLAHTHTHLPTLPIHPHPHTTHQALKSAFPRNAVDNQVVVNQENDRMSD